MHVHKPWLEDWWRRQERRKLPVLLVCGVGCGNIVGVHVDSGNGDFFLLFHAFHKIEYSCSWIPCKMSREDKTKKWGGRAKKESRAKQRAKSKAQNTARRPISTDPVARRTCPATACPSHVPADPNLSPSPNVFICASLRYVFNSSWPTPSHEQSPEQATRDGAVALTVTTTTQWSAGGKQETTRTCRNLVPHVSCPGTICSSEEAHGQ